MSDDKLDLTSRLLAWVSSNIKFIVIGVVIGVSIPLLWNFMQYKEQQKNLVASDLYYDFINIESTNEEIEQIRNKLKLEHSDSIYEVLSNFLSAKKEFENENYDLSMSYLQEILNININKTYNSLANIKIAIIYIQKEDYANALKKLDEVEMQNAFKQVLSEIKGDIYKYKGDKVKSLKFYDEAISASAINNENLLMKRNSVQN
tara:strand:+ start:1708 stop:2319 length:612 start_codon:yes stop_codon:yes gene_type:complete